MIDVIGQKIINFCTRLKYQALSFFITYDHWPMIFCYIHIMVHVLGIMYILPEAIS